MPHAPVRETMTVEEAGKVLGVGRAAAYRAVGRGDIPALRVGKKILIPRLALDRLLREAASLSKDDEE